MALAFFSTTTFAYSGESGGSGLAQVRGELWQFGVKGAPDYRDTLKLLSYLRQSQQELIEAEDDLWPYSYPEELVFPVNRMKVL